MQKSRNSPLLRRRVVWVTGASRGIGFEIAKQFASIGCVVCLSGRHMKSLRAAAALITESGGTAHPFPCDVREARSVLAAARRIGLKAGEIDVLINNAGITLFRSFLNTSLKEFHDVIATNLEGQIACIKAVVPSMAKRRQGWIFNIISMVALKTFGGSSAYTAAKVGMFGFGKVLREEMKQYNVRITNVIPGATETEMWSKENRKKFSYRMMKPKSVAELVLAAYQSPDDAVVDEIVIRPILGDID